MPVRPNDHDDGGNGEARLSGERIGEKIDEAPSSEMGFGATHPQSDQQQASCGSERASYPIIANPVDTAAATVSQIPEPTNHTQQQSPHPHRSSSQRDSASNSGSDSDSSRWLYVPPAPGCAVVNLGDAMVEWTGGLLRSCLHRVNVPPGEQVGRDRYSVAYLCRPWAGARMKTLMGGLNGEGKKNDVVVGEGIGVEGMRKGDGERDAVGRGIEMGVRGIAVGMRGGEGKEGFVREEEKFAAGGGKGEEQEDQEEDQDEGMTAREWERVKARGIQDGVNRARG